MRTVCILRKICLSGDYYYEEINTLDGYVLDNTRYSVSLVSSGQTVEVIMTNSRFRAKLVIVKQDGETKSAAFRCRIPLVQCIR